MSNTKPRKLTIVRTPTHPLRLEPGEAVHVGVDVHKATYSVALYSDGRGLLATWVQPARPEVLIERLSPVREGVAQVVSEAGPTGFGLARRLRAEGFRAQVIAPSKLLTPVGPEAKSDRLDCRRLAQLSAKGLLHPVRVPTEQEEADRQVLRLREQLVRKTHSVQSQIKSFLLQHGIAEPAGLGQSWVIARSRRHRAATAVLWSVPGVGPVTAATFRLELPEPQRFDHGDQVARMAGLAPQVRQSGQTRHEGGLLNLNQA